VARAYIAVGSNIEPRKIFIDSAVKKMKDDRAIILRKRSSLYDTFPEGGTPKDRYLNGAIEIDTSLGPRALLRRLLRLERALGRKRTRRGGPRTIDLDILLYDDLMLRDNGIRIPHPRMHKRDFVIFGMNEIAPETTHPALKMKIGDIYKKRRLRLIKNPAEAYRYLNSMRKKDRRVGLVPTMGALHEGHFSLIRAARRENDIVVVSVFVNPAQFTPGEDYRRYPRDIAGDRALAKKNGADVIFYPSARDMYGPGHRTHVEVEGVSDRLCGHFRPGHFRGVATVVTKLFNILPADNAYFGRKDAQQAFIIKRMARDLNIPVKIKTLPTVRERHGLAMSSRNAYLSEKDRREAAVLFRALSLAKDLVKKGERESAEIIKQMRKMIRAESSAKIEYLSIVDTEGFGNLKRLRGEALVAVAARFGKTRLIDNVILNARGRR